MSAAKDQDFLDFYIGDLDNKGRPWSVISYRNKLRHFLGWLDREKLTLQQVIPRDVQRYLVWKKHKDRWNYHSLVQILSVLRCFFRYLMNRCLIAINPTEGVACAWLDTEGGWESAPRWLKEIFRYPIDARRFLMPLFSPHLENYIRLFQSKGYSQKHIGESLNATRQFCGFLKRFQLAHIGQITTGHHEAFLRHASIRFLRRHRRPAPKEYIQAWRSAGQRFLQFAFKEMGRNFLPPRRERASQSLPPSLLEDYLEFCRVHRGLKEVTWRGHYKYLLRLGVFLDCRGIKRVRNITISDLDAFLVEQASRLSRRSLGCIGSALRSFFDYLFLQNKIQSNPADHLIFPSRFRDDLRPKYIPWPRVQAFLAGIDRSVAIGKRDYAVIVLLAAYGLRIREVAALTLADIDWKGKRLILRQRKGGEMAVFPLKPEVETALKDYLDNARPKVNFPEIFIASRAPIRPMSNQALQSQVGELLTRFDPAVPIRGPYLLRHSFAKALLDRGAPLTTVKELLGHRSWKATAVYTRIATEDLREVARNYAGLL